MSRAGGSLLTCAQVSVRMGAELRRGRDQEEKATCGCVDTINNIRQFSLLKEQGGEP